MTKLYASSSGTSSSHGVSYGPSQEPTDDRFERLMREIRNQLDEFPVGETVLVGNCPPDINEDEINSFFHGFANAVCLKKVCCKALTTTLFIAKFDSAESASRSKVLHTLSLKDKKILLLQYDDRQLFGRNNVVELNGFQDQPEEVIYDHMSAFGQVNFILKTKSVAYIVYEDSSSVDASSRCEYLDQYPVTIRSVLDTSIGSVTGGSAADPIGILEQIDQHSSLLVEEEEGQINNFIQLLDMDNLDEYMEMNEREKSTVVDKPLLEVGNEEIIANESEEDANVADVAAIEKQALQRPSDQRCHQVEPGFVLVDDRSAARLRLAGNLLRLSNLPRLNVRVQKIARPRKAGESAHDKKHKKKVFDDSKSKKNRTEGIASEKRKKDKSKKQHGDDVSKVKSEKSKSKDGTHRDASPSTKSDKPKKEHNKTSQNTDDAIKIKPEPEKAENNGRVESKVQQEVSPSKKSNKEKPKKDRTKSVQSTDVVIKIEPVPEKAPETGCRSDLPPSDNKNHDKTKRDDKKDEPRQSSTASPKSEQTNRKQLKPMVVLKRLTAKQLEELSIVRRENAATAVVDTVERDGPKQEEHDKHEIKHREKEKRKKSRHSNESDVKKRKIADEADKPKEPEKELDVTVLDTEKLEPETKEDGADVETIVEVEVPMINEVPMVVEESSNSVVDADKPDCSTALLSDDEEERLVIDLPVESKPVVEKQRTVVKLDTRSAVILSDKVHDTFLLHLDVLSRVLVKLNKISIVGYDLPKPVRPSKPKSSSEPPSRKSTGEVLAKKKDERSVEKARKTDLEKIDSKFLPAGSKLKSQAKAKSKLESGHKKQHHVPVPELPIELKTHLNTSFKIPKKNSHSSKAHSFKHSRSELDCLHRADEEKERQRKRFQKEQKHPGDRHREKTKKPAPVEQPDFFDPTWDDDGGGGGGGGATPPEREPSPLEQEKVDDSWRVKKPFVPNSNEREMDKKGPSFRDIWNLPPEKPQVWANDPWAQNSTRGNTTIDSGEMWSSQTPQPAAPVLPLFARDQSSNQRNNNIGPGDRWSPERGRRPSPSFTGRKLPDTTAKQGNTIESGESWSPGRAPPTTERRPKQSDPKTIADGESWSPEADTKMKIIALNLDHGRPPSRQREPQQSRRIVSPAPRGAPTTISTGDMWDIEPSPTSSKRMPSVQIWENPSKENLVPDFLSDEVIRGATDKPWASDRFRGGRNSPDGRDDRGRRRSRDRSLEDAVERKRRWSPNRSPVRRRSPDRRPWNRDGSFNRGLERSPSPRRCSQDRRNWDRDGPFNRSLERSPPRRYSPERRHWAREGSPSRGNVDVRLSPDRPNYARDSSPMHRRLSRSRTPEYARQRSPDERRPWSPFGRGVVDQRRSRSRSPLRRMMGRSRSPEQHRQSPVRRGAARFRSRSRSRDRYEDQYRKRSRSPPRRHQRETTHERERGDWGRPRARDDAFSTDRNVFCSPTRGHWDAPSPQRSPSPLGRMEAAHPTDDEIPYSPSNFLDEEEDNFAAPLETIPLQLPPIAKSSSRKLAETQVRIKQEQLQTPTESAPPKEVPVAVMVETPVKVKQELDRTTEQPEIEQRPPSSAKIAQEPEPSNRDKSTEQLSLLKQRAERLKKLEEMRLARQKLLAQIKLQNEKDKQENEMAPGGPHEEEPAQKEEQEQQQVPPEVRKVPKMEPECERVSTPIVTDIKQEPHQVEPAAATLLLETAVSILSSFSHLLPAIGSLQTTASPVPPPPFPPLPEPPVLAPPLPVEAPKPPPPDEPPPLPLELGPMPSFPIVPPPTWEPPCFPPLPNLGLPPPPMSNNDISFNMPSQPAPFEEEQQRFQDFPTGQEDMDNTGCYQENNYDEVPNWQSQGPSFDEGYEDQPQNFNYDDGPNNWQRRPQEQMNFSNDGSDWQPNYFNNQQQEGELQLLPPEEFRELRNGPQQFDGGFNNQRNRDPRKRFRGNNRGQNNNNAYRDPRRNRGGSIYAGGQQQQQQQWNRNVNNNNFNRGGGGFGNQYRNNQNRNNNNNRRRGGFKNFQQRPQQRQQGDEFFIDMGGNGGGDDSNWDGFMQ